MAVFPFDTNRLIELCRKNDVAMIGIFGSMARGEATEQSDADDSPTVQLLYHDSPSTIKSST
jgi:hypothetical protein